MIKREQYLTKLRAVKDKHLIKVITGVRRSGKSVLLMQFRDELLSSGVHPSQIQFLNFEEAENGAYSQSWQDIHADIVKHLQLGKTNYIFLDEIQNIPDWERLVDSLYAKPYTDLYITGSNAYLLSSELATILSGRQYEVSILPFSYREYTEAIGGATEASLLDYLRFGGMPQAVEFRDNQTLASEYLRGVYNTVVLKDILRRQGLRDAELLDRIIRYAFDNIGNVFSAKKVSDYLCSNYRQVSSQTVENYLLAAQDAFILYSAQRFNVRGKELLKTNRKYYVVDLGFRGALLARGDAFDVGRALENTVYLELIRRGCQVFVGQTKNDREVDFAAKTPSGELTYYQVTETMRGADTRQRELSALRDIADDYPKYVLTLDPEDNNYDGIVQLNVQKWLLDVSE